MKYNYVVAGVIFCFVLFAPYGTLAQDTSKTDSTSQTLQQVLREHRYPITVNDNKLGGKGGRWLVQQAKKATIVTIGETHASREIPELMNMLFQELQRADEMDYLAVEASPWTVKQMTQKLRQSRGAYNGFIEEYPNAVPFYNFQAERDLIAEFVQDSDAKLPLWGMDQIFVFSTKLVLDRLQALAPTNGVEKIIQKIRDAAQSKKVDDARHKKSPAGIPTPISIFEPVTFDTLKKHYEGIIEAQQLLEEVSKSIKIYQLNDTNNYVSNQIRAKYMRNNLHDSTKEAISNLEKVPQIVIKTGGRHAVRGMTANNALDVGNLAIALAEYSNRTAFNVGIFCGPGSEMTTFPAQTTSCWEAYKNSLGEEFGNLSQKQTNIFDLSEVHRLLHEGKIRAEPQLEELIWGFDAVVFVPNASAAEHIASPVKQ